MDWNAKDTAPKDRNFIAKYSLADPDWCEYTAWWDGTNDTFVFCEPEGWVAVDGDFVWKDE